MTAHCNCLLMETCDLLTTIKVCSILRPSADISDYLEFQRDWGHQPTCIDTVLPKYFVSPPRGKEFITTITDIDGSNA